MRALIPVGVAHALEKHLYMSENTSSAESLLQASKILPSVILTVFYNQQNQMLNPPILENLPYRILSRWVALFSCVSSHAFIAESSVCQAYIPV